MPIEQTSKEKARRLSSTRVGGKMVADYWENIFTAKERGKHVVWYNGAALNRCSRPRAWSGVTAKHSPPVWQPSTSKDPPRRPVPSTATSVSSVPTREHIWAAPC